MIIICDWCYAAGKAETTAKYVIVTGDVSTMKVTEFFICDSHAELMVNNQYAAITFQDTKMDEWELHWITEQAREFYKRKSEKRQRDWIYSQLGIQSHSANPGHIPYTVQKLDPWRVHGGWFYRNPREIRKPVSVQGIPVGARTPLWNSSHRGT